MMAVAAIMSFISCSNDDDSHGTTPGLSIEEHFDSLFYLLGTYTTLYYTQIDGRYQLALSNGQIYTEPQGMHIITSITPHDHSTEQQTTSSAVYPYTLHDVFFYNGMSKVISKLETDDLTWSKLYGKNMVVAGGSMASNVEAKTALDYWTGKLHISYTNIGVSGGGFSKLTGFQNIQTQISKITTDDMPAYDIYLLWASTNDFAQGMECLGEVDDYSEKDGYDTGKWNTQCGGINHCVEMIRKKNPDAAIYFFSSLPVRKWGARSWDADYRDKDGLNSFVSRQREICARHDIPFLDLFRYVDREKLSKGFKNDGLHLKEKGYEVIREQMLNFVVAN